MKQFQQHPPKDIYNMNQQLIRFTQKTKMLKHDIAIRLQLRERIAYKFEANPPGSALNHGNSTAPAQGRVAGRSPHGHGVDIFSTQIRKMQHIHLKSGTDAQSNHLSRSPGLEPPATMLHHLPRLYMDPLPMMSVGRSG